MFLASALAIPVWAQQAPSATASAVGTVFDSLRLRHLAGARIRVDSTELTAIVDAEGRFHIEKIPPGTHYLSVEHPLLDTAGVILRSDPENYVAGETHMTELGTPAPETLIGALCSPAWRARGPAALLGRVREADSGSPATGAKVSLVWYELAVGAGIRKVPRVRESLVGPDGIYRICGLPAEVDGRLQVIRGPLTSGDIPISFGHDLLAMRSLTIAAPSALVASTAPSDSSQPAAPRASARGTGTARLTGRVLSKDGRPLVGARIQLEGTTRAAQTRTGGDFVLDSLPPGTQTVSVRLLGYAPIESAVDLSSRDSKTVTLTMDNFVPVLETVRVDAQRERGLDDVGFARRKRSGQGWTMDADAIKSRNAMMFSDILRSAPGLRITSQNGQQMIESARDPTGGCINIWLDGTQWQQLEPGDVDQFVKPYELGAIEVYSPATTPAEYQPSGRTGCSTIVAWTLRRLERKR